MKERYKKFKKFTKDTLIGLLIGFTEGLNVSKINKKPRDTNTIENVRRFNKHQQKELYEAFYYVKRDINKIKFENFIFQIVVICMLIYLVFFK